MKHKAKTLVNVMITEIKQPESFQTVINKLPFTAPIHLKCRNLEPQQMQVAIYVTYGTVQVLRNARG